MRLSTALNTLFRILLITCVASAQRQRPINRAPDYSTWEGTYTFVENGGSTAAGTPIVVEHKIRIYRSADHLLADIDANGFQTAVALTCDTSVLGNRINLYYKNRREGDTSSQTIDSQDKVKDMYSAGQLLLTLEKSVMPRTTKILTYWRGYQPVEIQPRNGKVYFTKSLAAS
jgi:hypothetical protein